LLEFVMVEQRFPDDPPSPPATNWPVKILVWAIVGAILGALWGVSRFPSEDWVPQSILLAIVFAVVGALFSLVIGKGCKT
jgi:hypothetical protein